MKVVTETDFMDSFDRFLVDLRSFLCYEHGRDKKGEVPDPAEMTMWDVLSWSNTTASRKRGMKGIPPLFQVLLVTNFTSGLYDSMKAN